MITSGDETGFHLLVADERDAYRWRSVATLSEPGWLTDQWIGQHCVTGSGRRAVVVYAPRQFTNREELMDRGGFAAVVDLDTGAVTKLGRGASLAYYNPGCGVDETAVVSRLVSGADRAGTWLGLVDAAAGKVTRQVTAAGQLTSAIPYRGEVAAARTASVVAFDAAGRERKLFGTPGVPFRVYPDAEAGLAFQTADDTTVHFHRFAGSRVTGVGKAARGTVKLRPGAGGRVFLAGYRATGTMPARLAGGWKAVDTAADSDFSTTGTLAISRVSTGKEAAGRVEVAPASDGMPDRVAITARTVTGSPVAFSTRPEPAAGQRSAAPPRAASTDPPYDHSTVTSEPDRLCGISRNDEAIQVYQPNFRQVEWAADLAVYNMLTFQRPANWSNNGLPAYSPQGLFPQIPLSGGGTVPAQVMLGILAQESNLWQASWHAVDGSAGNPLTSLGYYGLDLENPDYLDIPWRDPDAKVDCGYGVAQVTTGMRMDERGETIDGLYITMLHQKAVALDYATNIAAGLRILQSKWNQTRDAGLIANNGDPRYIENWWFAIWAYNTGFWRYEDRHQHNGSWGVGWSNNPANPKYPADRQMFLTAPLDVPEEFIDDEIGYDNAKHPNHWSYPERVIGWAYTSLIKVDYQAHDFAPTYRTAMPGMDKFRAQPRNFTFCSPLPIDQGGNECAPGTKHENELGDPPGPCTRPDLTCWWHYPVSWTDCGRDCGLEYRTYASVEPRPYYDSIYPSQCSLAGLPSGVRIIDDLNDVTAKLGPGGCTPNWTRGGRFSWKFGEHVRNGYPIYPSKVDFHQIGAGFGGHFWFAHTMPEIDGDVLNTPRKVTGTWWIEPTNAWTRVFVHVPDHGAHTRQADYQIYLPGQTTPGKHRAIPTRWERNTWVDIGVFDFRGSGSPRVELSNFTRDGRYVEDIAWDAIAVQPLTEKPRHFVVGLGDSYSSGEGAGGYTRVSNQYGDDSSRRNSCRRGEHAWARKIQLPNAPAPLGRLDDGNDPRLDFHFLACSGARTHNVMTTLDARGLPADPNASGQAPGGVRGELSQLDAGFLDENTTLVVLTIGGNDAEWSAISRICAEIEHCQDSRPDGGSQTLREIVTARIRTKVAPDVRRSIDEIRRLAPNALIELAGYPQLFATGSTYEFYVGGGPSGQPVRLMIFDRDETDFMRDVAAQLATEVLVSDSANRKISVDVRTEFAGHEVRGSEEAYLNGFVLGDVLEDEDGDPQQPMSMEGYHPTVAGYDAYGRVVSAHLSAFGYVW